MSVHMLGCPLAVAFSPGNHLVACGSTKAIAMWDLSGKVHKSVQTSGFVSAMAFSPDGTRLASGLTTGLIEIRSTQKDDGMDPQVTLTGHTDHIWSLAFSPDGLQLASGSRDRSLRVWDLKEGIGQACAPYELSGEAFTAVGFVSKSSWSDGRLLK